MRIVSWNIRAGGGARVERILGQIERWAPDIVGLCEFRASPPSRRLATALFDLGFEHQITTADAAYPGRNALLLASRLPLRRHALRLAPSEPGRWLVATAFEERPFVVALMHIPNMVTRRKLPFMEAVAALTTGWRRGPAVLLGDTNCGWPGLDEETSVFGPRTAAWLDGLQARGWRDAFRHLRGDERVFTWYSPNGGNGFRLDQAFVNRRMISRLRSVRYEWGRVDGVEAPRQVLSDHAALILDFDLDHDGEALGQITGYDSEDSSDRREYLMAEEAEPGKTYEIEIVEETTDEGPFGIAYIGDALVTVPNAKIGDKLSVKITAVVPNYWTNKKEAYFVKA
ncbi:MAG: TRAM domain-containing protein [Dehalococcoidia bacterium]|nr:TRAM domain-containing protein [Dehalococcoidia bacterium]